MNAYELADAIEDWDSDGQWDTPAAEMLRQQADRIAELEKKLEEVKDDAEFQYNCYMSAVIEKDILEDRLHWLVQHPVKQLSKYEISEIVDEIFGVQPSDDMTYFYDFYNAIIKEITE